MCTSGTRKASDSPIKKKSIYREKKKKKVKIEKKRNKKKRSQNREQKKKVNFEEPLTLLLNSDCTQE